MRLDDKVWTQKLQNTLTVLLQVVLLAEWRGHVNSNIRRIEGRKRET